MKVAPYKPYPVYGSLGLGLLSIVSIIIYNKIINGCICRLNGGSKLKRKFLLFFLGGLCFTISQPLLRLPILNYLQGSTSFILFYSLNPLLTGILIALSAGVFEEGFRFCFKRFALRPVKLGIIEPIIFGLGHGLAEALIILLPYIFILPIESLYLAILERFLAIILHIGLSIIIWNGFQLNKRYLYLGIAILLHGLINSLIPIFGSSENQILIIESSLALIDILIIIYIFKSRKYYLGEEKL